VTFVTAHVLTALYFCREILFTHYLKFKIMTKNIGSIDKIIRLALAGFFAVLYFTGVAQGVFGIILLILAGVLVLTSLGGFCLLYTMAGISTCRAKKQPRPASEPTL